MESKTGILLVNLGSPDSPSVPDVRRYLREFLMDERVIDVAWPLRAFIVYGTVLPFRPKQSAHAYQTIWTKEGSPLVITSKALAKELGQRFTCPVELAMRYQNPSIPDAINNLLYVGVKHVVLVPLFPHYAMSSYETAVERVREVLEQQSPGAKLTVVPPFYKHFNYIEALVESAKPYLQEPFDHLLFSYHGIPERQILKCDPTGAHCLKSPNCCDMVCPANNRCYKSHCVQTTKYFVEMAGIPADKYSISFQSRLGRDPWLQPFTDLELPRLAREGKKRIVVMSAAFVADCLETIEELGLRGRESFLEAGGEKFTLVPCLNTHPRWIDGLESIILEQMPARALDSVLNV
jgi:ferrochelatase